MEADMDNKTFNLWKLLGEYDVVVPVIQRDYAQGRKGKEYVRKTFLSEIKSYLCDKKVATLDFIYGNINGKRFYPLDGQQRLTSMYILLKALYDAAKGVSVRIESEIEEVMFNRNCDKNIN